MASEKSIMAVIRAARPSFRNSSDRVAFAVHASFLASGYVLIATGAPAFDDDALDSSSTDEVGDDHWNDGENEYAFIYLDPEQGGKKVLVKGLVMGDKFLLNAVADDDDSDQLHLEIPIGEFVGEEGGTTISAQFKNLDKLVRDLNDHVFSKLHPPEAESSSGNQPRSESRAVPRHGRDESSSRNTEPSYPPVRPSGGGIGDCGSMLLGPNDPRWFRGDPASFPDGQLGVPPGSRFDPYGPPGVPGFEPNRFTRNPPRPGGAPHPDLDHFHDGDII